jgi:hypothetical protein
MVNISSESPAETERRLLNVIKECRLKIFHDKWTFLEMPLEHFPEGIRKDALALVRDEEVWSQLVPSNNNENELFSLFSFHFPAELDNSGFVGWLASLLKKRFGTGVFVICGQNSNDGGIFDYWGCPAKLGEAVISEIHKLMMPNDHRNSLS